MTDLRKALTDALADYDGDIGTFAYQTPPDHWSVCARTALASPPTSDFITGYAAGIEAGAKWHDDEAARFADGFEDSEIGETHREYAAAIRALPVPAGPWGPMESAPKDRFIILWCKDDRSRWLARWQDGQWFGVDDTGLTRTGASVGSADVVTGWFVNGWQDLPSPPTGGAT